MTQFSFTVLGSFAVAVDGQPITHFPTDKVRALLAYLAVEAEQPHNRSTLAALLWPDINSKHALRNLRNTLHRLKQTLDKRSPDLIDQLLEITRQTIQFKPEISTQPAQTIMVDITDFQALVAANQIHQHARLADCPDCLSRLTEAAGLYQGELLAGFGLVDAPPFEEWLTLRREMLHQQAIIVLQSLAEAYEAQADYDRAHTFAQRLLSLDTYREDAHQQLMRLLALRGLPDQALAQYASCRQLLRTELGVEPSPETVALVEQIRRGEIGRISPPPNLPQLGEGTDVLPPQQQLPPQAGEGRGGVELYDVPDPGPFFGRVAERQQLAQWLRHDRVRTVAILAIGGMGKTTLTAQSVRELAADATNPFDVVLWRSLVNAPPLTELLPPMLQILSGQQLTAIPDSLDEQLRLFSGYLRKQRVLLVLDNMESILEPEQAGAYRAGYEPYGQLIQQMATLEHQSHLVLTSRERPMGYDRLERDSNRIQSLQLSGLGEEAGYELLAARGLFGAGEDEAKLIERYSGNPLALKLVADTVDELFFGDLQEFLADESLIFDDIRTVLDQHFGRLTDLEQQILFWLAVEREPTSSQSLRQSLLRLPKQRDFLEALRGLQRRSLVERFGAELGLQNVVTEYLMDQLVEMAVAEIEAGVLNRLQQHALLKAQAKDYVRESQMRLILNPIGEQLIERLGAAGLQTKIQQILSELRVHAPRAPHYAGGNLLNLLISLEFDLTDYDFSQLSIWQAHLQNATLRNVNFRAADFADTLFVDTFGGLHAIAIHPDNDLLASNGGESQIRLWRLSDGQLIASLSGHSMGCTSLDFHPAGRLLASGGLHSTIRFWDIESGRSIHTLRGHQGSAKCVAFSPDGRLLTSAGNDHTVCIWAVDTATLLAKLPPHNGRINTVAYHPDGHILATTDDSDVMLWDIEHDSIQSDQSPVDLDPDRLITRLAGHHGVVRDFAFSSDGTLLAAGNGDGTISLWDIENQSLVQVLEGHTGSITNIALTPNNELMASSSIDGTIRLWDMVSRQVVDVLRGHLSFVWKMTMSADGQHLVSGGTDGVIRHWDLQTSGERRINRTFQGRLKGMSSVAVSSLGITPDGAFLATGGNNGWCHLWHLSATLEADSSRATSRVSATYRHVLKGHSGAIQATTFRPRKAELATVGDDQTVRIWDAQSGQCLMVLQEHNARVNCVVYNKAGTHMVTGDEDGIITLWSIDDWGHYQRTDALQASRSAIRALTLSPDETLLAASTTDATIRLWEMTSGECVAIKPLAGENAWALDFEPTGERLLSGLADGTLQVWTVTGQTIEGPIQTIRHAESPVTAVAFSPSGDLVASGGLHSTIRIWETATWAERHSFHNDTQGIRDLAFCPDSYFLVSTGGDGLIKLHDAETGTLLHTLEVPGPYEGMNITGVTGISEAQRAALRTLGAVENGDMTD
ncbi:MAG: BTAD domain-containing putative transcriptional regulator [Chloroflexota bacterium]